MILLILARCRPAHTPPRASSPVLAANRGSVCSPSGWLAPVGTACGEPIRCSLQRWGVAPLSRFVREPVDGLCKTASNLCTIQGYLGIQAAGRDYHKPAAWKNTMHILCTERTAPLSTHHKAITSK